MATTRTVPADHSSPWGTEDRLAVRLRVSHLLNMADIEPASLPPSATLIVRRLRDPLPRRFCSDLQSFRAAALWERATQSALAEVGRGAARPAQGSVPTTAAAVLFADSTELLACLVCDLSTGQAPSRWWWRAPLRAIRCSPGEEIFAALVREPACVPAVFAQLDAWGELTNVTRTLAPSAARVLLQEIAEVHEVRSLARALFCGFAERTSGKDDTPDSGGSLANELSTTFAPPPFPWEPVVKASATPASLGVERCALLGVGLLLFRAPHRVRSPQFESVVRAWARDSFSVPGKVQPLREAAEMERQIQAGAGNPTFGAGRGQTPSEEETDRQRAFNAHGEKAPAGDLDIIADGARSEPSLGSYTKDANLLGKPGVERSGNNGSQADGANAGACAPASSDGAEQSPAIESIHRARRWNWTELSFGPGVATNHGGVLFLIPFLRALGFPEVLAREFGIDEPINGWALLRLVARGLLGGAGALVDADPVWDVLRLLEGKEESNSSDPEFMGQPIYRLPTAWRSAVPENGAVGVSVRFKSHRLLVRHELGFILSDWRSPTTIRNSEVLAEVANLGCKRVAVDSRQRRAARARAAKLSEPLLGEWESSPELKRFLHFLLPYFRWRLCDALAKSAKSPKEAAVDLLYRSGKLYVTSTHVDLVMDLDDVSVPARLAGLDTNPGWVPELGRVVSFHYR